MQIVQHTGEKVVKILRDKQGRLVHATFYVYETAGRIRARLLEWNFVAELAGNTLSLATPKHLKSEQGISFVKSFVSPYFTKDVLNFLGNKPRAPTF